jgi:hypothetical protein
MTPAVLAAAPVSLEALIAKWREEARAEAKFGGHEAANALRACAYDLATLRATPAQPGDSEPDSSCTEADGCPTELAVLQRHWRARQGAIIAAYMRGANWALENGAICAPYLSKAASDYADKHHSEPKGHEPPPDDIGPYPAAPSEVSP